MNQVWVAPVASRPFKIERRCRTWCQTLKAAYVAAKHGLEGLSKVIALEAARATRGGRLSALGREGSGADLGGLGFVGVLLGDRADVEGYVRSALGPVLDYDATRGSDLVATLRAYFECGGNLSRAKDVLHVHVNTVVQRLERVTVLLGDRWREPDEALEVRLALRLIVLSG